MGARLTSALDQHRNSSIVVVMVESSRIEIKEPTVAVEVGLFVGMGVDTWV